MKTSCAMPKVLTKTIIKTKIMKMGDTKKSSCLAVFTWIIATLFFTIALSLIFRAALPILLGDNQTSNMFHTTNGLNDRDVPLAGSTVPPVPNESTPGNSLNTEFNVIFSTDESQLSPYDITIDVLELLFAVMRADSDIPTGEAKDSLLTTQMTIQETEHDLHVPTVDFEPNSPKTGRDLLTNKMTDLLNAVANEDGFAFNSLTFKDVATFLMNSETVLATTTGPELEEMASNIDDFPADESTFTIPIIEVLLLNDTSGATGAEMPTGTTDNLPDLEVEADEITTNINSTLERHENMADDFVLKTTIPPRVEMDSTAVLLSSVVTSVIKRPAPFPDSLVSNNKRSVRPVVTAEKVSAPYSYDFFRGNVGYAKSVEICRQIGRGSRLLSIEAAQEERIVDAYVKSHQNEIFRYDDRYSRYIWTGGYFDLESCQPYELRWVDHPTPMEISSFRNFCPESSNVQSIIDKAVFSLKAQTSDLSNLNPCDQRWAHVILDFNGHRIGRSCWQILDREILSADDWKLPFICKR